MPNPPKDANDALRKVGSGAAEGAVPSEPAKEGTLASLRSVATSDGASGFGFERTNAQLVIDMIMAAQQPTHERIETFADIREEVIWLCADSWVAVVALLKLICSTHPR
jgi:hypothetical protein